MELSAVGESLEQMADTIVERAEELSTDEPYASLAEELRLDHLVPLLRTMIAAAFDPNDAVTVRDVIAAAAEHGRQRADQGFSEGDILLEYQILRRAVERFLLQRPEGFSDEDRWKALLGIDAQISTATSASLFGVHTSSLDPGRLEGLNEELARARARPRRWRREGSAPSA